MLPSTFFFCFKLIDKCDLSNTEKSCLVADMCSSPGEVTVAPVQQWHETVTKKKLDDPCLTAPVIIHPLEQCLA